MHLAWRITDLERDDRLATLRRAGVAVVRWAGAGRTGAAEDFEALVRAAERGARR